MDPIQLSIFANRLAGICDEMGALLRASALSPNIKDRLDFSCAIFDADGGLCAQAAHIPVHLGSMAYAMADLVDGRDWRPGDLLVVNDPYLGGTHLPDVTVVAPVFVDDAPRAFTVTRAHHANIGAHSPGSMPVSRTLEEEGLVIAPQWLKRAGQWQLPLCQQLAGLAPDPATTTPPLSVPRFADFAAQASACQAGARRLAELIAERGPVALERALAALNDYGERRMRQRLADLADGSYRFRDWMDDDGQGQEDIVIAVTLTVDGDRAHLDFTGTADQVAGNINCPLSVAAAAAWYCFRCLLPDDAPSCAGLFRPLTLTAPEGSLVNARRPGAVAAGNVETSSRIVDVVLGALAEALPEAIPAASQGTMNNLAMGAGGECPWDYYETMAGGMGAHAAGDGLSAVHSHMTNTLNTPIESLEAHYPLRVLRYALRRGSGGAGLHRGGDGIERVLEFLAPARFTLLTERRRHRPWGLAGGEPGAAGENRLNGESLPPKYSAEAGPGDRLSLASPGGGGYRVAR
ncbi:hydantoinase B/oxoprolinase family protein [Alloalcanivorax marinus]|uniref:hydantoinase B/oxoprolinase family protein n=1 Tax=Alloalcanivorax marinus TaxID=1177169 RepID=UPI00193247BA|nr:hydantoinase B/oxoprolinase family protein [Alloalcanivorax marinus]MBL7251576.1 hydantoinase B/oxoprolinase family protein [Alloalcanivorax marinus]